MLSNEANLLWFSSVSLFHTSSSQVETLHWFLFVCLFRLFVLRKNIKEYLKIVICTYFFSLLSVFPFFLQRNGDSQGQRLCQGTGHLPPTSASEAQGCWHPCSEQHFPPSACEDQVNRLWWLCGCLEALRWEGWRNLVAVGTLKCRRCSWMATKDLIYRSFKQVQGTTAAKCRYKPSQEEVSL